MATTRPITDDKLLLRIAAAGAAGLSRSWIYQDLGGVRKAQLDPMLDRLVAAGLVEARAVVYRHSRGQTSSTCYFAKPQASRSPT